MSQDVAVSDGTALRARFRIEPSEEAGCALLGVGERGEEINRNQYCPDTGCSTGCECRATVAVKEGGSHSQRFLRSKIDEHCICPVFQHNDCVPAIEGVRNDSFIVSVTLPTRSVLRSLVEELRARGATVNLERIVPLSDTVGDNDQLLLDVQAITDKQQEAIETAVEIGYYDQPRRANLEDLSKKLGVSRSAVSQRLNAAETKLVREFTDAWGASKELSSSVPATPSPAD